ncbi:MAG: hypothetical protein ACK46Q_05635 [Hyphomonas sp.]
MAKTAVTFLRGWSRYNTGDVAAFESDQAKGLTDAGIAALAPPKKSTKAAPEMLSINLDLRDSPAFKDVQDEIRRTVARLADQEAALEARAASLDDRAAELAGREAELNAREDEVLALAKAMDAAGDQADASDGAGPEGAEETPALAPTPADAAKASKGGLPKQGR